MSLVVIVMITSCTQQGESGELINRAVVVGTGTYGMTSSEEVV